MLYIKFSKVRFVLSFIFLKLQKLIYIHISSYYNMSLIINMSFFLFTKVICKMSCWKSSLVCKPLQETGSITLTWIQQIRLWAATWAPFYTSLHFGEWSLLNSLLTAPFCFLLWVFWQLPLDNFDSKEIFKKGGFRFWTSEYEKNEWYTAFYEKYCCFSIYWDVFYSSIIHKLILKPNVSQN